MNKTFFSLFILSQTKKLFKQTPHTLEIFLIHHSDIEEKKFPFSREFRLIYWNLLNVIIRNKNFSELHVIDVPLISIVLEFILIHFSDVIYVQCICISSINLSAILHLEICFISFLFSFPWKFNIVCIIETNKMKKRNVLKLNRKGNTQNMFQFNLLFKCYEIVQFYRFNNIQWDLNQLHTIFLLIKAMFKSVKLICFISGTK